MGGMGSMGSMGSMGGSQFQTMPVSPMGGSQFQTMPVMTAQTTSLATMTPGSMQQMQQHPTSLHHGFGASDSFAHPQNAVGTLATMKGGDEHTAALRAHDAPLGLEMMSPFAGNVLSVGEYRPVYPAPETAQYGFTEKEVLEKAAVVQARWCSKVPEFGTWGRANLKNICDAPSSLAERMVSSWQWVYVHADGWDINFWPEDFALAKATDNQNGGEMVPICSIDIRQIFAVNVMFEATSAEGARAPWEIKLNFANGYFPFRVRSQNDANSWNARIMRGVVENVKVAQMRNKYAEQLYMHEGADFDDHRIPKCPGRVAKLKKLWHDAIESVEKGVSPPKQIYYEMYQIYDALENPMSVDGAGDGNLTMAEIEVMARELIDMKALEVRMVVVQQEKTLFSSFKPVSAFHEVKLRWTVEQGRQLLEHYDAQRDPKEFFDRVVNFHHRTDISREGKVDLTEFLNAAP